jgi:lipoate-protein ligase A
MTEPIQPLRYADRDPSEDPTGESLLDRSLPPWSAWIPSRPVVVLGNSQDPERELQVAAVLRDRIPVHKRICGGGAVLLSPACICLSLRFRKRHGVTIKDYFALGSSVIIETCRNRFGGDLFLRGISDLACSTPNGDKKVAGSSLYLPRDFALYLVSILVAPDLGPIGEYLLHPSQEPDYRMGRSHGEFLASLSEAAGRPLDPRDVLEWFKETIPERLGAELDWEGKS